MADPEVIFCVGAAKAGTSWLYRYLHDRDDCHLRSVKELHYFDSRTPEAKARQVAAFEGRLAGFRDSYRAEKDGPRGWRRRNLERRMADMEALLDVIRAEADGDARYMAYLTEGRQQEVLVADLTPAYSLIPEARLAHMVAVAPQAKFLYLMRDPVGRMWSHVRMQADRNPDKATPIEVRARRILNRTVNKGMETHIPERGDYRAAVEKLRRVVPEGQLFVGYAERMYNEEGLAEICAFLGLGYEAPSSDGKVHEGPKAKLNEAQRQEAAAFLADQYRFAERNFPPLPEAWRANSTRV